MTAVLGAVRHLFVRPAATSGREDASEREQAPSRPAGPGPAVVTAKIDAARGLFVRPAGTRIREDASAREQVAMSVDVALLCSPQTAWATAAALALGAARASRARGAVVAVWSPSSQRVAPGAGFATLASRRLATRMAERGLTAAARGRLVVVLLPDEPDEARVAAERVAATADVPLVTVLAGPRPEVLDRFLAERERVIVGLAPEAPEGVADLATVEAARIARATGQLDLPATTGTRLAARSGWLLTPAARAAVDLALRGHAG